MTQVPQRLENLEIYGNSHGTIMEHKQLANDNGICDQSLNFTILAPEFHIISVIFLLAFQNLASV